MIPKKLSPLSREQYRFILNSKARQNWAHGPVRCGKNFAINIRFTEALRTAPKGFEYTDVALTGSSKKAIYRVFLKDLFEWIGVSNYTYDKSTGSGRIFDRDFYSFAYGDADSHEAISGSTFGLAYMTEGIYAHQDFHKQLMARLSVEDLDDPLLFAMLFGDTNPGGPQHWLWKNVINNPELLKALDVAAFPFTFDSNRSISQGYRDSLKRLYRPGSLWFKRMILGLWVMAEGIIYASFQHGKNTWPIQKMPTKGFDRTIIACDYGTQNPFAALLVGLKDGVFYVLDEYYHNGREQGQKTNLQYADELYEWIGGRTVDSLYLDPSASGMRIELKNHSKFKDAAIPIKLAENAVSDGIQSVDSAIYEGNLVASEICTHLLEEIGTYAWDPNAQKRGEDKPLKKDDHACDALRYAIHTELTRISLGDDDEAWDAIDDEF